MDHGSVVPLMETVSRQDLSYQPRICVDQNVDISNFNLEFPEVLRGLELLKRRFLIREIHMLCKRWLGQGHTSSIISL